MVDVPQPPENPFMNENGDVNGTVDYTADDQQMDEGTPDVSARPGRVLVVLGVVGLILAGLLYTIFGSDKKGPSNVPKKGTVAVDTSNLTPPPLPTAPEAPPNLPSNFTMPTGLAPVPIPEPISKADIINPKEDAASKQQAMDRQKSKMMVSDSSGGLGGAFSGGSTSASGGAAKPQAVATSADPNAAFEASVINNSEAEKATATQIGDLRHTIAQGRIIQATMESALNTDLPAPIRAIVSRDTYGEAGREPLIPKGSRLIGKYSTDISGAQSRVFVVWTRVIRPDGVDVQLGSPLVDQIGQAGVGGQIDTKFQSIFSRSILSSVVAIGAAMASDSISGGSTTTASSATGGSSTTGDAATTATVDALNRLGGVSDSFIKRFIDVRPTILVDQGTPVNVFVNRDLIFPSDLSASGARIVN